MEMESSSDVKSVRLPSFDGTREGFPVWWTRFRAYATVYKFDLAISKDGPEDDLPASESTAIDESTADGKKALAAKQRNAVAIANLSMALASETLMRLIYRAQTTEWPGGLASTVVAGLFQKFRPIDTMTLVELRQALGKVHMKKGEDPATIFEQIGAIENRFASGAGTIAAEELIAVVVSVATEEYAAVLTTEQRIQGNSLTIDHLESAMTQHFRKLYPDGDTKSNSGNEIGLAAFNGVCFKCGDKGHKANDCTKSTSNGGNNKSNNNGGGKQGGNHKDKKCTSIDSTNEERNIYEEQD